MEYELINPSDNYTFVAEDYETAVLTVFCLGTAYGAQPKDGGESVPVFLLGGAIEWYIEKFGHSPDDGLAAKRLAVADALSSMMLGGFEDRRRYEAALAAIDDPEKRARFIDEWQDGRTSLNDIGHTAHRCAERLRQMEVRKKRKYYRECGLCGARYEQSGMIMTHYSETGWVCGDCFITIIYPQYYGEEW